MTAENIAISFARVLRGAGVAVPLDSVLTFVQALEVVSLEHREDVYWAGRATLVRKPEDHGVFDRRKRSPCSLMTKTMVQTKRPRQSTTTQH
jgi:uncharacterized protein with von Willebrand factor type A (vWA) domain